MPHSIFPKGDPDVIKLVNRFGGWQRVLDPLFSPPEELYLGFEEAGYTRERLDKMRLTESQTEREAWIETVANCFYGWWRASHLMMGTRYRHFRFPGYPGLTPGLRWQDYPINPDVNPGWGMYKDEMTRLSISRDDIDAWIDSRRERYPIPWLNEP